MKKKELKEFLNEKVAFYNKPSFIENDPIQIPHLFTKKEDIEIAGFLIATIAWGNRKSIIQNGKNLMDLMDNSPHDFITNHTVDDLIRFDSFKHRTFNEIDCVTFIKALRNIYVNHNGIEKIFTINQGEKSMHESISAFRDIFFEIPHWVRTRKHISDPRTKSASKRMHMYLRWMIRNDKTGVDFGIWKDIPTSKLSCPLDVHTGNVARKLGLIERNKNDFKALLELDANLRKFDEKDPSKYDFALFGLGAYENF